jgi:hypothetical protein
MPWHLAMGAVTLIVDCSAWTARPLYQPATHAHSGRDGEAMNSELKAFRMLVCAALIGLGVLGTMGRASANTIDINVTFANGFVFNETSPEQISLGFADPVLNLTYGNIYVFNVNTLSIDPIFLSTDISANRNTASPSAFVLPGVTGVATSAGTITIDATNNLFPTLSYMDAVHGDLFSNLIFFSDPVSVPGPIVGAGPPGLIFASGGLFAWWRRKQKAAAAVA